MFYSFCSSPVGRLDLASDGESLVGLWIAGQKYHGASIFPDLDPKEDLPVFVEVKKWLGCYFDGKRPSITDLPLAPIGSDFRQSVWDILRGIPYGEWITYGEIASQIAAKQKRKSMSAQAVGGAVGHNPISIIIPCHRVVGSNGNLTGYAGGIPTKLKLLQWEGVDISGFYGEGYL